MLPSADVGTERRQGKAENLSSKAELIVLFNCTGRLDGLFAQSGDAVDTNEFDTSFSRFHLVLKVLKAF